MARSIVFLTCLGFFLGVQAEVKEIGSMYQCAHDFRGKVLVKNEREIIIEGMNYDGKGPAAWFHGQLRPASKGIDTSDPTKYVTLPYPDESCERLQVGRSYKDENVTLILPRSVKDFETIGIFCYQYCHNFGHIVIPENLSVDPAPAGLLATSECPKPNYNGCPSPRNGALRPDCKAGASTTMGGDGSGAAKFTFISGWFIVSMFLTFKN